jgi:hypothetical protein
MGVVPPDEFARRLRRLDAGARARFVAAVCEARGREASVDGRRVRVAAGPDEGARTLWVAPDRRRVDPPADVDVVVARGRRVRDSGAGDARAVETLDPSRLRDRLLYALDRETAGRLCRRHLGCDLEGWPTGADRDAADAGRTGRAARAVAATVALAAVLAAVVATGLGPTAAGPLPAVGPGGAAPAPATGTATATAGESTAGATGARADGERDDGDRESRDDPSTSALGPLPIEWSTDDGYPPGVIPSGVTSAATLARAHEDALRTPYTWRVSYRERRNGTVEGEWTATVRVADGTTFATSIDATGSLDAEPPPGVPRRERYADGAREYVRRTPGRDADGAALARRGPRGTDADRYVAAAGGLVRRTLGANETAVAEPVEDDGRRLYRVRASGSAAPDARNATGRAIVTEFGLVEALVHSYTPVDRPDTRVVLSFEYRFGPVALDRPPWLDGSASGDADDAAREPAGRDGTRTATPA